MTSDAVQGSTPGFIGRTDTGLPFVRTSAHKSPPFTGAAAEKFVRARGFRPATAEERRQAREAMARTDERTARKHGARKAA